MASNAKARARSARQDATQILTADHKNVSKIFSEYEKATDGDTARKQDLVKKACDELAVHAQVEEEIFYPALHEAFKETDEALVDEAEVEHAGIKQLIATLRSSGAEDARKAQSMEEYGMEPQDAAPALSRGPAPRHA
jgi:hemerythrin superfamily protein